MRNGLEPRKAGDMSKQMCVDLDSHETRLSGFLLIVSYFSCDFLFIHPLPPKTPHYLSIEKYLLNACEVYSLHRINRDKSYQQLTQKSFEKRNVIRIGHMRGISHDH